MEAALFPPHGPEGTVKRAAVSSVTLHLYLQLLQQFCLQLIPALHTILDSQSVLIQGTFVKVHQLTERNSPGSYIVSRGSVCFYFFVQSLPPPVFVVLSSSLLSSLSPGSFQRITPWAGWGSRSLRATEQCHLWWCLNVLGVAVVTTLPHKLHQTTVLQKQAKTEGTVTDGSSPVQPASQAEDILCHDVIY